MGSPTFAIMNRMIRHGQPNEVSNEQLVRLVESGFWDLAVDAPDYNAAAALLRAEAAKPQPIIAGTTINFGNGWLFTIDEIDELEVNYGFSPDELSRRMNLDMKNDWDYIGTPPKPEVRKVKAAIGYLNRTCWTEKQMTELLAKPGSPSKGSGAWVLEAYLVKRPHYDGNGSIGFPDAESSRWRRRRDRGVCFPFLWGDGAGGWDRNLHGVENVWPREDRLCFICG